MKPLLAVAFGFFAISVTAFTYVVEHQPFNKDRYGKVTTAVKRSSGEYDFLHPHSSNELPDELLEVSGLTNLDGNTLASVQDEDGIVFIYDLTQKKVIREIEFAGPGDYEGIARANNSLYVLRSDGKIFEIDDYRADKFEVTSFNTDVPVKESEGLSFDAGNNRLLIAGKSKSKDDHYENMKVVYGFDLTKKEVLPAPVFTFSEDQIARALKSYGATKSGKKKGKEAGINPSGIAIHPITGQVYILSSQDHLLYVMSKAGEVEGVHPLDKKHFAQPEGITFLKNGDMYISNEGKKGGPTLLGFGYGKAK
ncbi:SdiA-regulated domain-containing protein [Neolewinella aurantiaca]|nr:SdiA-regulated domain-containing protein [Neolewinella aurantiaca]